jgi:hypothetical protein
MRTTSRLAIIALAASLSGLALAGTASAGVPAGGPKIGGCNAAGTVNPEVIDVAAGIANTGPIDSCVSGVN